MHGDGVSRLWDLMKSADIDKKIICCCTKKASDIKALHLADFERWAKKNRIKKQVEKENKNGAPQDPDGYSRDSLEKFCIQEYGLYPSYCYTVLNIAEFSGERLVRLRSSRGGVEWVGDWGDTSDKWENVRVEFRAENMRDGIFYMSFDDFVLYFDFVVLNYFADTYTHTAFEDVLKGSEINCYELEISKPGEYYITVHQPEDGIFDARGKIRPKMSQKFNFYLIVQFKSIYGYKLFWFRLCERWLCLDGGLSSTDLLQGWYQRKEER